MHPAFQRFAEYLKNGDYAGLDAFLNSGMGFKELAVVKCLTCEKVLALEEFPQCLTVGITGRDKKLQYLVYRHLNENREHEVVMHTSIKDFPLGAMYLTALDRGAQMHGLSLDEAFNTRLAYLKNRVNT